MSAIERLRQENEELRRRLSEAEETLDAIRAGEVDAIVVEGPQGDRIFSLTGADRIYRVLVETMNEAALTVAPDGTILFCNQRFSDLMRALHTETVGRTLEAFAAAEERPALAALLEAARTAPAQRHFVLRAADGTAVPVQLAASPLEPGERGSVCVVASDLTQLEASARSITVLKEHARAMDEAQSALAASYAKFQALIETTSDFIWETDAEGRYTYCSPQMEALWGIKPADMIGKTPFDVMPPEDRERGAAAFAELARAPRSFSGLETTARVAGDRLAFIETSGVPILATDGRLLGFRGISRDVTERRAAEETLRRAGEERRAAEAARAERERLLAVLEALPAMIRLLTPDYHIAFANRSYRDRFGETKGRRCYEADFDRDESCEFCETYGVLQSGWPHRWEVATRDGGALEVFALPFTDTDGSPLILEMNVDITERRRAEQALRDAHQDLAQRVSQLRALAGELTLSEQRERWRLARVLHDHLQQLLVAAKFRTAIVGRVGDKQTQHAAAEIEHLLDESITSARLLTAELSPPVLHQAGLAAGLEWLARWMSDRHGLQVDLEVENGLPALADDVRVLLFESVRELLFNAVKHARVASARVSVMRAAEGAIRIAVSDSGVGFDPAALKKVGETGGGFGLFSIRERLDLLGGRLDIDSAPGLGSRFTLTAPPGRLAAGAAPAAAAAVRPTGAEPAVWARSLAKGSVIRVLIADDHAVVREGLRRLLGDEPNMLLVGEAIDGEEVVELAGTLHPDVILMDLSMPKLNGVEATREIHREHPGIRIIGLSMFEDADRAKAMREAGAIGYLTKSGPPDTLVSAIRLACEEPAPDTRPSEPAEPVRGNEF